MKDLELEIKQSIEKNLPKQVGEVLANRLAEIPKLESELERVKDFLERVSKRSSELESELSKVNSIKEWESSLTTKENELLNLERTLKIKELEYKLESEQDKTKFTKEVALGLVRNSEFRSTVFDNVSEPGGTDQYGNPLYVNKTQNYTKTDTIQ